MKDIHNHLLYGIDDGSENYKKSVKESVDDTFLKLFIPGDITFESVSNLIEQVNFDNENEIKVLDYYIDKFEKYYDVFEKENTLHPKHPDRLAVEAEHEKNRKSALIDKLKILKIDGWEEDWTADKLQKFLENAIDVMEEEQVGSKVTVTENDGVTSIEPNMNTSEAEKSESSGEDIK